MVKTMARVWTLVGLVGAVAVLLFLVFIIESEIHAKVEELKHRKTIKELNKLNKELDKCISNLSLSNDDIINLLDELDEEDKNE